MYVVIFTHLQLRCTISLKNECRQQVIVLSTHTACDLDANAVTGILYHVTVVTDNLKYLHWSLHQNYASYWICHWIMLFSTFIKKHILLDFQFVFIYVKDGIQYNCFYTLWFYAFLSHAFKTSFWSGTHRLHWVAKEAHNIKMVKGSCFRRSWFNQNLSAAGLEAADPWCSYGIQDSLDQGEQEQWCPCCFALDWCMVDTVLSAETSTFPVSKSCWY